eukprot:COSAG01_NODE_76_length_28332_cov_298.876992_9_plen_221_part_00
MSCVSTVAVNLPPLIAGRSFFFHTSRTLAVDPCFHPIESRQIEMGALARPRLGSATARSPFERWRTQTCRRRRHFFYLASPLCTAINLKKVVHVVAWAWAPCVLPGDRGEGARGGRQGPRAADGTAAHVSRGVGDVRRGAPALAALVLGPLEAAALRGDAVAGEHPCPKRPERGSFGQLGGALWSAGRGAVVSWAGRPFVCSPRQPSLTHMTAVSLAEQP